MQLVILIKNVLQVSSAPASTHVLNLNNKRRLHISKLRSLCEEKDNLKRSWGTSPDPIPIEGENNMLENVLSTDIYASLDFKCFDCYPNTRSFQELTAKEVIL
jgi:hypothetical protein